MTAVLASRPTAQAKISVPYVHVDRVIGRAWQALLVQL